MTRRPDFDRRKFKELVLYIAHKSADDDKFGSTKLNKLLYNADFRSYLQLGRPITGARYQHQPQGPTARALLPVQDEMYDYGEARIEVRDYYGREQNRLFPLREPNTGVFTPEELVIVDDEIRTSWGKDAATMSYLSHGGKGWQITRDGEDIPYVAVFLSPGPIPMRALEVGKDIAAEYGWTIG